MITEQNKQDLIDAVKPSVSASLYVKRVADIFNIAASTPFFLGVNFFTAPIAVLAGAASMFKVALDKKAANVATLDEGAEIQSHRAAFNKASGKFMLNQGISMALTAATPVLTSASVVTFFLDQNVMTLAGIAATFLSAAGGAVAGWKAHNNAVEMSRNQAAINIERLSMK